MEEADVQPAARILNEGHFYFADQELRNALAAVKAVDPHAAGALFERWRDDGRIRPDLDADRRHHIAPRPDPRDDGSLAAEDHLYATDRAPFRSALDRAENLGRDTPNEQSEEPRQGHRR